MRDKSTAAHRLKTEFPRLETHGKRDTQVSSHLTVDALKKRIPLLDESAHVFGENKLLGYPAEKTQRCREGHSVKHERAFAVRTEFVLMGEVAERSSGLFICEASRWAHSGDSTRHPQGEPEVPCAPGDVFVEADDSTSDTTDYRLSEHRHGIRVSADVPCEIEQSFRRQH